MFGGSSFTSTPTFGGGGFSTPATNTSVFGQPQQSTGSTNLFGSSFSQPKPTFGASSFGAPQQTSMFGAQNRLQPPAGGGLFGTQTAAVSPFSATTTTQGTVGTPIPFTPINGTDTMMKNGQASPISTRHQCITCMKDYENKSLEELRLEDYQLNRKGPQQGSGMFGGTVQSQQSSGLFSGLGATSTASPFGQTSTFGATSTTGNSLFGSFNQPKPAGFFSTPTTSAFGTSSAFTFNTSQPSVFGATNNPVSTGGLGSTSTFSFGQGNQSTGGMFGQKPLTSTPNTGFGFGSAFTNTSTANKPPTLGFSGFGTSTAPTFGSTTTSNFGAGTSVFGSQAQTQNKPFSFSSPFSSQAQPTQPTFGAPSNTGFSFGSGGSAPSLNFGTSTNTFGTPGLTTGTFGAPTFGAPQQSTGFGFGMNTTTSSAFPSFTPSLTFSQPSLQQSSMAVQAPVLGFATTPYKDSPLFYNLIANRDLENMVKPTSPAAQRAIKEASRRRTSTSLTFAAATPLQKNVTFPTTRNLNKSIFDGFEEEEDKDLSLDILSPKSSIKKLALKSFKPVANSTRHSVSFTGMPSRTSLGLIENGLNDSIVSELNASQVEHNESDGVLFNEEVSITPKDARSFSVIAKRLSGDGNALANGFEHACRVLNTRTGYYIDPPIETLDKMVDDAGNCIVTGLKIGRHGHGEIRFIGPVNIFGVNIDETVHFRHKEVVVYPDDFSKPPLGSGLNCPAVVSLERVWPIDKSTRDPIKEPSQLQLTGYESMLRKACQRLGAEFISYMPESGIWVFKVPHFSKYSCEVEESEVENAQDPSHTDPTKTGSPSSIPQVPYPPHGSARGPAVDSRMHRLVTATKPWEASCLEESMPVFRSRSSRFSPEIMPLAARRTAEDENMSLGMEDFDFVVEHNPLTPTSESNESNSEFPSIPASHYDSVLRDRSDKPAVHIMKSALLCTDMDEEMEVPPPFKKSRLPLVRAKDATSRNVEIKVSSAKQRKSVIDLQRQRPGPPVGPMVALAERKNAPQDASMYPSNYVTTIVRRDVTVPPRLQEDLFAKCLLHTTNTQRHKAKPRVTFGPLGTFVVINNCNPITPSAIVCRIESFQNQMVEGVLTEALQEQLRKQLPWRNVDAEDQLAVLWNLRTKYKNSKNASFLKEEIMMWELFQILWPEVESQDMEFYLQRREAVERWLSKYCCDLFPDVLPENPQKSLLGLMKMGRREDAWKMAVKSRNPCLALLMCQSPLEMVTSSTTEEQLRVWEEENAMNFIPDDVKTMYRLCSGLTVLDDLDLTAMSTSDWLQHFALYLWYCCPPGVPVSEAVVSFQQLLKNQLILRGQLSEDEINTVAFPSVQKLSRSIPNLCIQLLKCFSFEGYPLRNVIDPDAYSLDCLNYKLAWMVMVHLQFRGHKADNELFLDIASGFAHQLEQIGLYTWSAFVMSKTPDRIPYHRILLERNLGKWGTVEDERFLLENELLDSYDVIYNARALREIMGKERGAWSGRIFYLFKAGHYQKAFEELQNLFGVDSINAEDSLRSFLTLLRLLKPFSQNIRQWNKWGTFMTDTFELLVTSKSLVSYNPGGNKDEGLGTVLTTFLKSFLNFQPMNSNESAIVIELSTVIQKAVAELLSTNGGKVEEIGSSNISALFDIPVPKDYRDELIYMINYWLK